MLSDYLGYQCSGKSLEVQMYFKIACDSVSTKSGLPSSNVSLIPGILPRGKYLAIYSFITCSPVGKLTLTSSQGPILSDSWFKRAMIALAGWENS